MTSQQCSYEIKINRETKQVHVPSMTGAEILRLAGKDPRCDELVQKFPNHSHKTIKPDDVVSFERLGVECFVTVSLNCQEGTLRCG